MNNSSDNNSFKPRFNSLKLLFTAMTAFAIAFFTVYSAISLPYSEKTTECIVNILSSNIDDIWTWTVRSVHDNVNIKSPQLIKKLNLCNIYEARWTELWNEIYSMKFTWNTKGIVITYFVIWFLILLGVFINDVISWWPFICDFFKEKKKNKK